MLNPVTDENLVKYHLPPGYWSDLIQKKNLVNLFKNCSFFQTPNLVPFNHMCKTRSPCPQRATQSFLSDCPISRRKNCENHVRIVVAYFVLTIENAPAKIETKKMLMSKTRNSVGWLDQEQLIIFFIPLVSFNCKIIHTVIRNVSMRMSEMYSFVSLEYIIVQFNSSLFFFTLIPLVLDLIPARGARIPVLTGNQSRHLQQCTLSKRALT